MDTKDRPVTDEELLDLLEGMSEQDGELWQQVKEKGLTDDCLHLRLLAAASRIGQEEPDVEALLAAFHAGQSRKRRLRLRRWGLSLVGVAAAVKHLFGDANLFLIVLVGIAVVHIHDAGGIL